MESVHVTIPRELKRWLRSRAHGEGRSLASYIRKLLTAHHVEAQTIRHNQRLRDLHRVSPEGKAP